MHLGRFCSHKCKPVPYQTRTAIKFLAVGQNYGLKVWLVRGIINSSDEGSRSFRLGLCNVFPCWPCDYFAPLFFTPVSASSTHHICITAGLYMFYVHVRSICLRGSEQSVVGEVTAYWGALLGLMFMESDSGYCVFMTQPISCCLIDLHAYYVWLSEIIHLSLSMP